MLFTCTLEPRNGFEITFHFSSWIMSIAFSRYTLYSLVFHGTQAAQAMNRARFSFNWCWAEGWVHSFIYIVGKKRAKWSSNSRLKWSEGWKIVPVWQFSKERSLLIFSFRNSGQTKSWQILVFDLYIHSFGQSIEIAVILLRKIWFLTHPGLQSQIVAQKTCKLMQNL